MDTVVFIIVSLFLVVLIVGMAFLGSKKGGSTKEGFETNLEVDDFDKFVYENDIQYFKKFKNNNTMKQLLNNNMLGIKTAKKNRILFVTYENRDNEYTKLHDASMEAYCKKWGYSYKRVRQNKYDVNVYWVKLFLVQEELYSGKYDYVLWLDSDTVIKQMDIDIGDIFNSYSSDIFVGSDNNPKYDLINSGVFAIKNSVEGLNFLQDCIDKMTNKCFGPNGKAKGMWAASCYEQGVMNMVIADKYSKQTTVLPNKYIFNFNQCSNEVFIMHLYASSTADRVACFRNKEGPRKID